MCRDPVQVPLLAGTVWGVPDGHADRETDSGASRNAHLLEEGETAMSAVANIQSGMTVTFICELDLLLSNNWEWGNGGALLVYDTSGPFYLKCAMLK